MAAGELLRFAATSSPVSSSKGEEQGWARSVLPQTSPNFDHIFENKEKPGERTQRLEVLATKPEEDRCLIAGTFAVVERESTLQAVPWPPQVCCDVLTVTHGNTKGK